MNAGAYKVYAIHGLILSGIELALTIGNALNQEAFQLKSFSDLIFGGSVVIEGIGLVFAMGMAVMAYLNLLDPDIIGVGVPSMVIVEAMAMDNNNSNKSIIKKLCEMGFCLQSLCFLTFAVVSYIMSPSSVPMVVLWIVLVLSLIHI